MKADNITQNLFLYEEPTIDENVSLFHSENAPWFYHLINVLQINGSEFLKIKNYVTASKNEHAENNHILKIICFKTYVNEMLKLNKDLKNTLSVYLYYCKHILKKYAHNIESNDAQFVFVFGNVTADMDSVCSSIAFSFFLFLWNELKRKSDKTKEQTKPTFFIPVININKSHIWLKILMLWWMEKIEVYDPINTFVFQDNEHLLKVLKHKDKYIVCLVDFNDLGNNTLYDINNVKCIIDHHMCKEKYKGKNITKTICPIYVCSCMVIITYLYKFSSEFLGAPFVNKNIMWLMYGPILRDSNNFRPEDEGKRWTKSDLHIFNLLKLFYKIPKAMDIFITREFQRIRFSIDLKKFGIENLLMTDYKDYYYNVLKKNLHVRIASIDFSIDRLFFNEDVSALIKKLFEVCKEKGICLFIFFGSYLGSFDQLKKDIGFFFYTNDVDSTLLINKFLDDKCMNIIRKNEKTITNENITKKLHIFEVNNQKYSRKMLEYLLHDFFHGGDK